MESPVEVKRLQSCINDLISVLALPAIWTGRESSQILGTLLEVLLTMLRLDFAYARLSSTGDGQPIEVLRSCGQPHSSVEPQQVGQALEQWITGYQAASPCVVPSPTGDGQVSIASFSLGLQHEMGMLVVGSRRDDFPTEVEKLLLRVAVNQAAIGLQEARRSGEQKRLAEVLEQRVAERTRRLTALNEELRRSEEYLAEAQRVSHTGSFGWKVSSGEIVWSEETFRIFQYDPTTKPTLELIFQRVHPEDAAAVKHTAERASQDGKDFEHEYRLLMPNSSVKYVHVVARALSDASGSIEFVGAVMDVTDGRRTEEALQRSEAYLAEAQRLTHTGSWACNILTGELIHSSEEHSRLYGFDPEQGMPSFEEFVERIHPDDRARVLQAFENAGRVREDFDAYFRILLPDGTTKQVYGTGHPVFDQSGDVREFVGIVMDVTERVQAERERERLRQLQADLAHVNRVTTMGELTASLAHEVNQPIAAAVTNAGTCLRWLKRDEPDLEEAREAALRVVKDVTRAADIISRVRLLFKKGVPERELIDVNEVIREMIVLLRSEATRYNVSVQTRLAEDLPQVMGDRVQLQQILMNLMMNSIDAMKDVYGTRELAIQSQPGQNGELQVSVSDTGIGLPSKHSDQIFNAFFTTKPHGTGMGLSISRSIVESHGGRLWAADNSPRGASFHLTLPIRGELHK